ncbi:unnamed protein product [Schistosoma turkestanicum]|nr:unnamed protein product [Schistosoma turkestanicum]
MFYSIDLLSSHRGKFGIIWLAATRVRKQLSRKELNSVNIVTACNEITSYILGETQLRLSLYLASQLTFGVCIIYREKIVIMLRDLQELSQKAYATTSWSIDLPTCSKSHTKRKARVSIDDPEIPLFNLYNETNDFGNLQLPDLFWPNIKEPCLDFMDTQTLYQARNEDITLVEDPLIETTYGHFLFEEDLLPDFTTELMNRDDHPIQPIDLIPIDIHQSEHRHISKHLVYANEIGATEYSVLEETYHLDKSQRPIISVQTNVQEDNVATVDSTSNQFVPVCTETTAMKSPKDLNTMEVLVEENIDMSTVSQSSDIPISSVNVISAIVDNVQLPTAQLNTELIINDNNNNNNNNNNQLENLEQINIPLANDFVTETEITQIMPQLEEEKEEEKTIDGTLEQNIRPISISQLSPLHPVESGESTRHRRIKKHTSKLIIDEITRLTGSELRWNMSHGEETMVTRDTYLAESAPRSQTQHLLSRSVPRLFSVPSNLETALSLRLCELWCYHRRLCEKALQKRKWDELSVDLDEDPVQTKRHQTKSLSTTKMNTITEVNESSIEMQRIGADHSSVAVGSESLFGTSNIIDVTGNTNNQTDRLDNETTYHHDTLKEFLSEEFNKMSKDNDQLYAKCELTEANLFHYLRLLRSYLTDTNYPLSQQSTIINNPLYTTTTTDDCITHITAQTQYQQNNFNVTDTIVHHFAIEINDKLIQSTINNNNNIHPFLSLNKNIEKEFLFELNELALATKNLLNCWEMKSHEINYYSSICQQFFKVLLNFCMILIKPYYSYSTGEFDQFSNFNLNDLRVKVEKAEQQIIDLSNELKNHKIQLNQFTEKLEQQQLEIDNNMKRKLNNDQATNQQYMAGDENVPIQVANQFTNDKLEFNQKHSLYLTEQSLIKLAELYDFLQEQVIHKPNTLVKQNEQDNQLSIQTIDRILSEKFEIMEKNFSEKLQCILHVIYEELNWYKQIVAKLFDEKSILYELIGGTQVPKKEYIRKELGENKFRIKVASTEQIVNKSYTSSINIDKQCVKILNSTDTKIPTSSQESNIYNAENKELILESNKPIKKTFNRTNVVPMSTAIFDNKKWNNLKCILERSGPFHRSEFEPSNELLSMVREHVKILVIGAGGLGCELLKNLAMMGFCHLEVIDMDIIDISNLNRQFLFRSHDVGKPKANVAADFIMRRIPTCKVIPHYKKIQDFGASFYQQFNAVVCGLDSVIARRWINSMLASLVRYDSDGQPDPNTVIPLVDGGTEGFKGHVLVVLYGLTGCLECTLDLYPPPANFPLCTIAHTPRLPEHCIEYVRILLWSKENPFGDNIVIDGDSPEHIQWIYEKSCERANQFGISGVTLRLVQGVVKRIIPAVASTNAVIAAACATEVFKLITFCYDYLNNYMNFSDIDGVYTYGFSVERKPDCLACNNVPRTLKLQTPCTLKDVINILKTDPEFQMQSPSITTMLEGQHCSLYINLPELADTLKSNLSKSLQELGLTNEQIIYILHLNRLSCCLHVCSLFGYRSPSPIITINQSSKWFFTSTLTTNKLKPKSIKLVTLISEPYATQDAWNSTIPPPPESGPSDERCYTWSSVFSNSISKPIIIDVRSPGEFNEDHIYGAINIPVLDDKERAIVGRLFNEGDHVQARLYGASMVCANISNCLKQLASQYTPQLNNSLPVNQQHRMIKNKKTLKYPDFLIYCWRGGQRSSSLATILSETGWPANIYTLVGGYRSWRRLLLRQLDAWPRWSIPNPFWVISGLTGSGKSLILQELHEYGEIVLDLESLAEHKGSMFGGSQLSDTTNTTTSISSSSSSSNDTGDYQSPSITTYKGISQKIFESRLHHTMMTNQHRLLANKSKNVLWIECESRHIGPYCGISDGLWSRLRSTDPMIGTHRLWIDITEEARVAWILENYANVTKNIPQILSIVKSLNKYFPNKLINQWIDMIEREDFTSFITGLLRHHYDPLYRKNRCQLIENAKKSGLFHTITLQSVDKITIRTKILPQILDMAYSILMNLCCNFANHVRTYANFNYGIKLCKSLNSSSLSLLNQNLLKINKNELSTSSNLNRRPGIIYPRPVSRYWAIKKLSDPNQYTVDALPVLRTGGRGPDGKIQLKHVTTGLNRPWFMVDHNRSRQMLTKTIHEELVLQVKNTWWRHPFIALVASGEVKRWIIATVNMKPGDIIRSHVDIPAIPVDPKEGDAHPVGALPVGTIISQFEIKPGQGALFCRTAGSSATIFRRGKHVGSKLNEELNLTLLLTNELEDEHVVFVRTNGKRKIYKLLPTCMCVVGQVSNEHHDKFRFRKFGEKKWRGIKQRSGLWQRKTGRFGRKIKPIGPPVDLVSSKSSPEYYQFKCSYPGRSEVTNNKKRELFEMLHAEPELRPQPIPGRYNALPDKGRRRYRWCSWSSVR